jgi:hypothetical protein
MKTKKCSKCGEVKPVSEFHKRAASKDGYATRCKVCKKAENKAYRKTEKGKAQRAKAQAKYNKTEKGKATSAKAKAKYESKIPPAVYQIRCLVNQRVYVGQSMTPKRRQSDHWVLLNGCRHDNPYLQNDYNEYGRPAFVFEILECPKPEALLDCEKYWIDRTSANNYNIYCP